MNRTLRGSGSGLEQQQQKNSKNHYSTSPAAPPTISVADDGDSTFPVLANGHADADKKDVIDAGLRSLDHCMFFLLARWAHRVQRPRPRLPGQPPLNLPAEVHFVGSTH